jgi:hypothetical protein
MIDYKKILWDSYYSISGKQNKTVLLTAFFKSEAQKAKRDEFTEFDIFFLNLKNEIEQGKKDIEMQYFNDLHRDDWVITSVENGSGMNIGGEYIADKNDPRIQESLQQIREQQKHTKENGYKNNNWYKFKISYNEKDNCYSTKSDWFAKSIDFTYKNLEEWKNIIEQAEQELVPAVAQEETITNTKKHSQYSLTPEVKTVVKEQILPIWKKEILENTTDDIFFKAITTADFTYYYKKGQTQKVGYFIYSLKQIMGKVWVDEVVSKLNDTSATLLNFQKRTIPELKNAMKGITIVNTANNTFKIDTKTTFIDKTTGKPYWKAIK